MTADIVIQKFSETIARFGIPKIITSDGAKCFTGFEFQVYCENLGIRHMIIHFTQNPAVVRNQQSKQ